MSRERPDVWIIVELYGTEVESRYHRVLAGWHGGYLHGNSWRMSSGITDIEDAGEYWDIRNTSGSVYRCHKDNERFSGYTQGIYESYYGENSEEISVKHVPINDILALYPT